MRYFAEKLAGSEFGIYYMNYHSRIPYLGGFSSTNTLVPVEAVLDAGSFVDCAVGQSAVAFCPN